jgi:membrane-bound lytic murein transglycosylase A
MRSLVLASICAVAAPAKAAPETTASGAACACEPKEVEFASPPHDQLKLTRVKLTDVPGWVDDHVAEAVPAFLASCARLALLDDNAAVGSDGHGGVARQWRHACTAAAKLTAADEAAARAFFEAEFVAYAAAGNSGTTGKLTGFYVQQIHASRTKHGAFTIPVLARPPDLVMVELAQFIHDAHARRVWGRLEADGGLVPYFTRAEIRAGALASRHLELMYADDATDVLFAQIEGSAHATLDDGSDAWLEFAGKNGRAYKGVGGVLKELGESSPIGFTMQGIRKWFADHAARFDEIVDQDASYVFFKQSTLAGAVGSQQVILTPRRSLAVDRSLIALSTPIFVDTKAPVVGKPGTVAPWQHLVVAQDTGAGIQGAVRGDIYWGADRDAEELGGRMGGSGRYWLLLPKGVSK